MGSVHHQDSINVYPTAQIAKTMGSFYNLASLGSRVNGKWKFEGEWATLEFAVKR